MSTLSKINLYTFRDRKSRMQKKEPGTALHPKNEHTDQPKAVTEGQDNPVQWVPVIQETKPEPKSGPKAASGGRVTVTIGSFAILVEMGFDEATFARVCNSLKTLC